MPMSPERISPETARQFATLVIHPKGHHEHDAVTGAVIPPLSLSTTFAQAEPARPIGQFEYSRSDNPSRRVFEEAIAALERGKHGLAFASGSATTATIVYALPTGSHVVSISDVYGGTNRFLSRVASVAVTMIDMQQVDTVLAAIRPETRLVWIESPTNPTLRITDIAAVSHAVHAARPDIWVVVDNTFLTPFNQQPLLLGADIVVHSVTKYLNGHCDVVMGVAVTNDTAIYERLRFLQNAIGAVPSPFDCWLANRGLKTLAVRMRAHETNAAAIAVRLETHEKIAKVHYPGLPSHPQHNVARKQQTGFGGMISFALKPPFGGEAATKLTQSTRLFTLAESLGGVESLIEVPAVMTHASVPPEQRAQLGITDGFIRLSCGIEDSADLIQDLLQALDKI